MARVENTSQREIHMHLGKGENALKFVISRGQLGDNNNMNGVACEEGDPTKPVDVPLELLQEQIKNDKVVRAWFDSGDLVIVTGPKGAAGVLAADTGKKDDKTDGKTDGGKTDGKDKDKK